MMVGDRSSTSLPLWMFLVNLPLDKKRIKEEF